jgi:Mn2+/Fe2+ NRAMP family transporter
MSIPNSRLDGILKSLGPGLLWAGAAIGVSHLVQSTRAGASYGFGLVWAVLIVNLFKYPFFEFGPRYAAATGESLLEGYVRLGRWAMWIYLILTFGMMFTIQAAVTIVTATLAATLFGFQLSPVWWSAILLIVCALVLVPGKYSLLDKLIKLIIIILSVSTVAAVIAAILQGPVAMPTFEHPAVWNLAGVSFLVALMGWMPSAFDISVWNSFWTIERSKQTGHKPSMSEALFDFNLGYGGTTFLALCFLTLGALTMYGSGEEFSKSGIVFSGQFINMYVNSLGEWSRPIILIAAFTTMFSTTLTCLDAFPRVLSRSTQLITGIKPEEKPPIEKLYFIWMIVVIVGAISLLSVFFKGMTVMVDIATTLSFITAPILATINYKVVTGASMPEETKPSTWLKLLSLVGLLFLVGFALLFIIWKFFLT